MKHGSRTSRSKMTGSKRPFAIALSVPGQHRPFVRNVAKRLASVLGKQRVFFDEWFDAELKGSSGDLKLKRVYGEDAELVVPFFSRYYSKMWCQVEWHTIRVVLAQRREDDAVVPVQLDDTVVPGWEIIDIAIRRKASQSGSEIADKLLQVYRLRARHVRSGTEIEERGPETPEPHARAEHKRDGVARHRARRPTVVMMDSTLPDVVYDENTRAQGGTNADDITAVLSDQPLTLIK